ncbi:hypothetical protein [Sphingobacterium faecium]|nr:hypothetical protein [Sphingobacterium faecium]
MDIWKGGDGAASAWFRKQRYWDMLLPKDRKSLAHKKAPAV